MSAAQYVEAWLIKMLRCGEVYDKAVLKKILLEKVQESVRHNMRW